MIFSTASALPDSRLIDLDGKIVGGYQINIENSPHQISLQSLGNHICGGSIIHPKWILTAAHCTQGNTPKAMKVRVGSSRYNSGGEMIQVKNITQHPLFDYSNIDYDFSLLELASPITFDSTKHAIKLPTLNEKLADGVMLEVSGWGNTQNAAESRVILRAAKIPSVNQQTCNKAYQVCFL